MRKQSIISSRLVAILAALAVALVAVGVILSKCEGTAILETLFRMIMYLYLQMQQRLLY